MASTSAGSNKDYNLAMNLELNENRQSLRPRIQKETMANSLRFQVRGRISKTRLEEQQR